MSLLEEENQLREVVRLVGIDALSKEERMVLETAKSLREDFLHQNAFHEVDTYASMEKQFKMLRIIVHFHHAGMAALKKGASMSKLFDLPVREQIARMRYLEEKQIDRIDELEGTIKEQINGIVPVGGEQNVA
jgi:V/A-type H+-transporting ATPase subunit A